MPYAACSGMLHASIVSQRSLRKCFGAFEGEKYKRFFKKIDFCSWTFFTKYIYGFLLLNLEKSHSIGREVIN